MLKSPFFARLIAFVSKWAIRMILFTCRFEVEGMAEFNIQSKKRRCILMLWHNRLTLVAEILHRYAPENDYAAVVSNSRDAEPLALLASSYNGKTIRVSHDARFAALRKMTHHLKESSDVIIITPDGPRGPRYEVKPGIALAAKQSAALVFPFGWSCSRFWQLGTWDKMILPKPFSTIVVKIGESVELAKESENDSAAIYLEKRLTKTVNEACSKVTADQSRWPN